MLDVVIVGGGPAGLNAALVLGRCRRRVVLYDAGNPRNARSRGVNGFLSRDGIGPGELRRIGREQLAKYETISLRDAEVVDAKCLGEGFETTLADGTRYRSRKLLLATGTEVELPDIEGLPELYGRGVFDCPYCDGWEERDAPVAVYGRDQRGKGFALELLGWSSDVVLLTGGPSDLTKEDREELSRNGVTIREDVIERLEGDGNRLKQIRFSGGGTLPRQALFFLAEDRGVSRLATRLGCDTTDQGAAKTSTYEKTNVPGLFVAGDASRRVQFAIVAAAEGAMAAFAINNELLREDRR